MQKNYKLIVKNNLFAAQRNYSGLAKLDHAALIKAVLQKGYEEQLSRNQKQQFMLWSSHLKLADTNIFLLGEAHIATDIESACGREILSFFDIIGFEGVGEFSEDDDLSHTPYIAQSIGADVNVVKECQGQPPTLFQAQILFYILPRGRTIFHLEHNFRLNKLIDGKLMADFFNYYITFMRWFFHYVALPIASVNLIFDVMNGLSQSTLKSLIAVPLLYAVPRVTLYGAQRLAVTKYLSNRREETMVSNLLTQVEKGHENILIITGEGHRKNLEKKLIDHGAVCIQSLSPNDEEMINCKELRITSKKQ